MTNTPLQARQEGNPRRSRSAALERWARIALLALNAVKFITDLIQDDSR